MRHLLLSVLVFVASTVALASPHVRQSAGSSSGGSGEVLTGMHFPTSIDNHGRVAGYCRIPPNRTRACLWSEGNLIDLGYDVSLVNFDDAPFINKHGQVVGTAIYPGQTPFRRVLLWDKGTLTDLGNLGGDTFHWASDINDHGQVVGRSEQASRIIRTVLWDRGTLIDLGIAMSEPRINNRGQVIGWHGLDDRPFLRSYLWDNGILMELELFWSIAINDHGQIAGQRLSATEDAFFSAVWEDGVVTDLGQLDSAELYNVALDINNIGQVVGTSVRVEGDCGPTESRAFLWERGRMTDLGTLGGAATTALKINERGQVLGRNESVLPNCMGSINRRAFVWTKGTLTEIEPDGPSDIFPVDMNDRGQVIAVREDGSAFLWDNGTTIELGPEEKSAVMPPPQPSRSSGLRPATTMMGSSSRTLPPPSD